MKIHSLIALTTLFTLSSGCRYDTNITLSFEKANPQDDINRIHVWAQKLDATDAPTGAAIDLGEPSIIDGSKLQFATGQNSSATDDIFIDEPVMFFAAGCENASTVCEIQNAFYFGCSDAIGTPSADAPNVNLTIEMQEKEAALTRCRNGYGFDMTTRVRP